MEISSVEEYDNAIKEGYALGSYDVEKVLNDIEFKRAIKVRCKMRGLVYGMEWEGGEEEALKKVIERFGDCSIMYVKYTNTIRFKPKTREVSEIDLYCNYDSKQITDEKERKLNVFVGDTRSVNIKSLSISGKDIIAIKDLGHSGLQTGQFYDFDYGEIFNILTGL